MVSGETWGDQASTETIYLAFHYRPLEKSGMIKDLETKGLAFLVYLGDENNI